MRKVAVAFYGIPRAADVCFPSIESRILRPLSSSFEVKCFYHFYRKSEINNSRSGEFGRFQSTWYDYFSEFDGRIDPPELCLDEWNFQSIKAFGDVWGDDFQSLSNLVHQLNSIYQVTNAILDSETDFDCILFLRPDLLYHSGIPVQLIDLVSSSSSADVWVPAWQWFGGVNDRFALCTSRALEIYGKRVENIHSYVRSDRPLHAESLLEYSLNLYGANIKPLFINASRARIDGSIKAENFSFRSCMDLDRTSFSLQVELFKAKLLWNIGRYKSL